MTLLEMLLLLDIVLTMVLAVFAVKMIVNVIALLKLMNKSKGD